MPTMPTPRSQRRRTTALILGLALLLAVVAGGCRSIAGTGVTASDTVTRSVPSDPAPTVRVETFNGSIDVSTSPDAAVSATVRRTGEGSSRDDALADAAKIDVKLTATGGAIELKAVYTPSPDNVTGSRGANVRLIVPVGSTLDLATSNGEVATVGVTGPIAVDTSNGGVSLVGVAASVRVETSNGEVTVRGAATGVTARTSNGAVTVDGGTGVLDLDTSSGAIAVSGARGAALTARTTNAAVEFSGSLAAGDHRFETSNGSVRLTLPADAAFTIDATTSNSTVRCGFTLASGTLTDTEIQGTVGTAPTSAIVARTSNGEIVLAPAT